MTPAFRVSYPGIVRAALKELLTEATRQNPAFGRLALEAARTIDSRLRSIPRDWGEPCFTLPKLGLELRLAAVAPLAATYAVHQQQAVVFVPQSRQLSEPVELE